MPIHSVVALTRDLDSPLTVTPLRHHLVSGDTLGDRFDVALTRGGEPVPLTGASVQAYFIRSADGSTIPISGSAANNVASVTLPESCYAVPGRFTLTVKAALNGVSHAVWVGEGAVLRASTDALVDPDHTIPDLDELLAMIARIEGAVNSAQTAASAANTAKQSADKAATAANAAASSAAPWSNVAVTVAMLDPSASPVVTVTDVGSGKRMAFQLPRGLTGATPKLTIGKVTTGAAGSQATATITGTAEAPVLNLTIPRGDVGSIDRLTVNGVKADGAGNIQLTPAILGAVNKAGDTMTGNLRLSKSSPRVYLYNTSTGRTLSIINNATPNAGLYSDTESKWIIRHDASGKIHIPGVTWEAGDTISTKVHTTLNGIITSGSKNLHLLLSVGSAINASAVSVTELTGTLRGVAGYLDSDSSTRNLLDAPFTCSADIVNAHAGLIRLIITKSTAFGNATNNTPASLMAFSLSLKFS